MGLIHKKSIETLMLACCVALGASSSAIAATAISSDLHDSTGTFRLGVLNFTKSDGKKTLAGGASVYNYEYSRYRRMNQALVFGFRQATDSATKRDAYHSAYGGYRFFPMGVGFPVLTTLVMPRSPWIRGISPTRKPPLDLGILYLSHLLTVLEN